MPLRFLRDIIFNDSEKTIPHVRSMQQQLQGLGIFTIIERPALHPIKIFLRELLYYSAMVFLFTLLLLHILVPCVENALASLPDTSFVVKQLKGLLLSIKR